MLKDHESFLSRNLTFFQVLVLRILTCFQVGLVGRVLRFHPVDVQCDPNLPSLRDQTHVFHHLQLGQLWKYSEPRFVCFKVTDGAVPLFFYT